MTTAFPSLVFVTVGLASACAASVEGSDEPSADASGSVFACTAAAPVSAMQCDPASTSPVYDDGVCSDVEASLATCGVQPAPAEACNSIANDGVTVSVTLVAEELPIGNATGGDVVSGVYRLAAIVGYTGPQGAAGPSGETRRQTLFVTNDGAGTLAVESVLSKDGGADERLSISTALSGSTAVGTATCPESVSLGLGYYAASPTSYTAYEPSTGRVATFELE